MFKVKGPPVRLLFFGAQILFFWTSTIYLGAKPMSSRLPSICICTLTRSAGLDRNCATAPEATPLIADFLK